MSSASGIQVWPVALCGASGRMGRHASVLLGSHPNFELVASLGRGEVTAARLRDSGALLGLDLTVAGCGVHHGRLMLEAGLRPVIGTSGVSPSDNQELDAAARELELGGLVVPNFSAGMWLLQRAAQEAARWFTQVEIIERHGIHKLDAPSGTALDTAHRLRAVRGNDGAQEIPIHSIRLPGLRANQEVCFGGTGEQLRLVHETYSLQAYSAGILTSLRYAVGAVGVGRGLGIAIETCGLEQSPLDSV